MLPVVMLPVMPAVAADSVPAVVRLPPVTLPVATTVLVLMLGVAPDSTVLPPAGLVMITDVALALICALPRYMVLLARYRSFHRCVVEPRL